MTWQEFENKIDELTNKLDFKPDVVVGIARGGLIPTRLLAKNLKVREVYIVTIKKEIPRRLMTKIEADLSSLDVLLVEDSLETGQNLLAAKKYLEKSGARVKTAALYFRRNSKVTPDYFLQRVDTIPLFPWEDNQ